MKRQGFIFTVVAALTSPALAQPTVDWHVIAGGGGACSNDSITLSGTFGQCDAGPVLSGGAITFRGGFWLATPPAGPACGSADFNCDGDLGTDADIEAFFACLAGACPPSPCFSSADFNADGDLGTDADIEAFFRVLAGGSC